jgi:hypothetical protein
VKLLECLKETSSMDVFCCGKNFAYMHPSTSQKTVPIVLRAKGIISASLLGQCCVIPFHAVILIPDQSEEINCQHPSPYHEKNSLLWTSYCSSNCKETFFHWCLCSSNSKSRTQHAQTSGESTMTYSSL